MNRVALVTAHFPPSNLAGVHRARIWAQHLPEFGWKPTVITAHWRHYQEPLDWNLMKLVPDDLRIIRTNALGVRFSKLIGNMALRSLWWAKKELTRLVERGELDFIHIIVPDHYSALLGPLLHRSHRVPYGIDYMDPWVHASPGEKRFLSKAWISCALSYHLEPWSIKSARLLTGVSSASYQDVVDRNPVLAGEIVTAEIPMANSRSDYCSLSQDYRPESKLFDPNDGRTHIVYAGSIPPSFHGSLECFLSALKASVERNVFANGVKVWLIGTGTASHGGWKARIRNIVDRFSLSDHVVEHPSRVGYTDALWHLRAASAVLLLGSTQSHYTPSKVYQAVQCGNPVLALIPGEGTASEVLRSSGRALTVDYPGDSSIVIRELEQALQKLAGGWRGNDSSHLEDVDSCAARTGAQRLAEAMSLASRNRVQ